MRLTLIPVLVSSLCTLALPALAQDRPSSHLADDLYALTDAIGPRIAGSDAERRAREWVTERLRTLGVQDVHVDTVAAMDIGGGVLLDPPGWTWTRCVVQQRTPWATTLIGVPALYSPGTAGPVRGGLYVAPLPRFVEADVTAFIERHRGRLASKFLLLRETPAPVERDRLPPAGIYTPEQLMALSNFVPEPATSPASPPARSSGTPAPSGRDPRLVQQDRLMTFLRNEGALGLIGAGGSESQGGSIATSVIPVPPSIVVSPPPTVDLTPEHFNRLLSFAQRGENAEIELNVEVQTTTASGIHSVIGDLAGSDRADEIVMVGAHLDSLPGATGATDNATGVVTVLEALRLLVARNTPLRRTVRVAFWGGEELGLQGSRAYVRRHLQDDQGRPTPSAARLSAYFNLDYGSGRIRGVYLQGRRSLKPLFDRWLGEIDSRGELVATLRTTLGSDQAMFERAGVPGLSFVQDPLDYEMRTHHTTMDLSDYVRIPDVAASAATLAAILERVANAPDLLPR
ncbi:MAG TPA: M20/M25/M40 family metallo-hydrolase [Vicinamibacterales bacterium]|nr:M20/M25/M40 family metallo-hydrolase [Vicinamibacterales bacterium]